MLSPKGLARQWIILVIGDLACSTLSSWLSLEFTLRWTGIPAFRLNHFLLAALMAALNVPILYLQDLYTLDKPQSDSRIAASVVVAMAKLFVLVGIFAVALPQLRIGRVFLVTYVTFACIAITQWRILANRTLSVRFNVSVMIIGFNECAPMLIDAIREREHVGYQFAGFAVLNSGEDSSKIRRDDPFWPKDEIRVHSIETADDLVDRYGVNTVVMLDHTSTFGTMEQMVRCRVRGVRVFDFETFYERITGRLPVTYIRESWLLFSPGFAGTQWRYALKRVLDVAMSLALTIVSAPIVLVTAVAIKCESPGDIFYHQERIGLDGKKFRIHKLRSMRSDAELEGIAKWASRADPRVTRVGRIIRRLRIDELPQLLNVLRGEMSLVGPRPERPEIVANLCERIPFYGLRHLVRPGLTGWAQICFPYGASVEDAREKLSFDLYYIKNWSLGFEIQILLQTIKVVLFGRGAR